MSKDEKNSADVETENSFNKRNESPLAWLLPLLLLGLLLTLGYWYCTSPTA